jgi:hypothetical protein
MALPILNSYHNTSVHIALEQSGESIPVWDKPLDYRTQQSIDRVLEYFIRHGRQLIIDAEGDIVSVVTKIISDMKALTPEFMHDDVNVLMDHLIDWLCDYSEKTQIRFLSLSFSLKQKGS